MINAETLSDEQKGALLDLLILGMFSDRHLASVENERVKKLLNALGCKSDYQRQQLADASVARMREIDGAEHAIRAFILELARKFDTPETRRICVEALNDLLQSDGKISTDEQAVLDQLRETFAE